MDLPDEKIMCHRTGFEKSCFDMVTRCKCQLWVHVQGIDPQTEQVIAKGACADSWMPKLTIEVAQMVRQNTASTDKVACVVQKHADESVAIGAMAIQRARDAVESMLTDNNLLTSRPMTRSIPSSSTSFDAPHKLLINGSGDAGKLD